MSSFVRNKKQLYKAALWRKISAKVYSCRDSCSTVWQCSTTTTTTIGITQVHWNKYTDYILNFFEISQKVKHVTQSELNYKKSPVKIYLCRIKEQNFLLYFRPCTFMHFRFLSFFWLKSMRLYHKAVSEDWQTDRSSILISHQFW